jgi:hypothetical protein
MKMQLRLKALLPLAMVLLALMPISIVSAEKQIEIIWIQEGPTVYKATILYNGTAVNMTAQYINGEMKIVEINGVPQNSCTLSHPLLFENTINVNGR